MERGPPSVELQCLKSRSTGVQSLVTVLEQTLLYVSLKDHNAQVWSGPTAQATAISIGDHLRTGVPLKIAWAQAQKTSETERHTERK